MIKLSQGYLPSAADGLLESALASIATRNRDQQIVLEDLVLSRVLPWGNPESKWLRLALGLPGLSYTQYVELFTFLGRHPELFEQYMSHPLVTLDVWKYALKHIVRAQFGMEANWSQSSLHKFCELALQYDPLWADSATPSWVVATDPIDLIIQSMRHLYGDEVMWQRLTGLNLAWVPFLLDQADFIPKKMVSNNLIDQKLLARLLTHPDKPVRESGIKLACLVARSSASNVSELARAS